MSNILVRQSLGSLSHEEIEQWLDLFQECFHKDEAAARAIFRKYELHAEAAWFCLGFDDGELVACYSGIVLPFGADKIFLSTDTMSNGKMRNATVQLGTALYEALRASGVTAACGFPNKNIVKIRQRRLGWQIVGGISFYIGFPILWRLFRRRRVQALGTPVWHLRRPPEGFFAPSRPFVRLLGRNGLYGGRIPSLVLTGSSESPGPFFVRLPQSIVERKVFGFAILDSANDGVRLRMEHAARHLDLDTIDVP